MPKSEQHVMHESGEMYLETILVLSKELSVVRSVDIAKRMGFSKPTISEWMNKLRKEDYVRFGSHHEICLTEKGKNIAEKVYERHILLTSLFESFGVSAETAEKDACRVEHYISDETFNAMKKHYYDSAAKESKPNKDDKAGKNDKKEKESK